MRSLSAAVAWVKEECQSGIYPTLTDPEVQEIVQNNQRFAFWTPSTAYGYDDRVVPSDGTGASAKRNGYVYRCVIPGTTGTAQPTWLAYLEYVAASTSGFVYTVDYLQNKVQDAIIGDGTVLWQQFITDYAEQFDLQKSTFDCWNRKASKATIDTTFASDLQTFKLEQIIANCKTQASQYRPTRIA